MKFRLKNPFKRKKLAKQIPKLTEEKSGEKRYEDDDNYENEGSTSLRNSSIISDDDDDQSDIPMARTNSMMYYEQEQNVDFSRELVRKLSISSQRSSESLIDLKTSIQRAEESRRREEAALQNIDLGEKIGKLLSVPGQEYLPLPRTLSIGSRSKTSPHSSPRNSLRYAISPTSEILNEDILYDHIPVVETIKGHGKYYKHTIGREERRMSATNVRVSANMLERRPSNSTLERNKLSMPRVKKRRDSTLGRPGKTVTVQSIDKILEDVETMILELDPEVSKVSKSDKLPDSAGVAKMTEGIVYDGILDSYLLHTQDISKSVSIAAESVTKSAEAAMKTTKSWLSRVSGDFSEVPPEKYSSKFSVGNSADEKMKEIESLPEEAKPEPVITSRLQQRLKEKVMAHRKASIKKSTQANAEDLPVPKESAQSKKDEDLKQVDAQLKLALKNTDEESLLPIITMVQSLKDQEFLPEEYSMLMKKIKESLSELGIEEIQGLKPTESLDIEKRAADSKNIDESGADDVGVELNEKATEIIVMEEVQVIAQETRTETVLEPVENVAVDADAAIAESLSEKLSSPTSDVISDNSGYNGDVRNETVVLDAPLPSVTEIDKVDSLDSRRNGLVEESGNENILPATEVVGTPDPADDQKLEPDNVLEDGGSIIEVNGETQVGLTEETSIVAPILDVQDGRNPDPESILARDNSKDDDTNTSIAQPKSIDSTAEIIDNPIISLNETVNEQVAELTNAEVVLVDNIDNDDLSSPDTDKKQDVSRRSVPVAGPVVFEEKISPRRYSFGDEVENNFEQQHFKTRTNVSELKIFKDANEVVSAATPRTVSTYKLERGTSMKSNSSILSPAPSSVAVLLERARTYSAVSDISSTSKAAQYHKILDDKPSPARINSAPVTTQHPARRLTSQSPRPHSVSSLDPGRPLDLTYSITEEPIAEENSEPGANWKAYQGKTTSRPLKGAEFSGNLAQIYQELARLSELGDKESLAKVYAALDAYRNEQGIPAGSGSPAITLSRKFSMVLQKSSTSVKRSLTLFARRKKTSEQVSPTDSYVTIEKIELGRSEADSDLEQTPPTPPEKSLDRMRKLDSPEQVENLANDISMAESNLSEHQTQESKSSMEKTGLSNVFAKGPVKKPGIFSKISSKIGLNFRKK